MRTFLISASLLLPLVLVGLGVACGGSASESPWPAEPEQRELGPAAEASSFVRSSSEPPRSKDTDEDVRPDAGRPRKSAK